MKTISTLLIPAANQVLIYGKKLLADIPATKFARKPLQDGVITAINHPAFQYGHLSLYPERIAALFDLPKDGVKNPQGFKELFIKGSSCEDDILGNIYPSMQAITDHFFSAHQELLKLLSNVPDEVYYRVNQEEATKDRFELIGSFVLYLLTAHANTHFGQVSAWRRCVGLKGV